MRFDLKNMHVYVAGRRGTAASARRRRSARLFDSPRPDGMPQRLGDLAELKALGWFAAPPLSESLAAADVDFLATGGRMAA
jgi:hypothetical protein